MSGNFKRKRGGEILLFLFPIGLGLSMHGRSSRASTKEFRLDANLSFF